jgi:hypothetical protein
MSYHLPQKTCAPVGQWPVNPPYYTYRGPQCCVNQPLAYLPVQNCRVGNWYSAPVPNYPIFTNNPIEQREKYWTPRASYLNHVANQSDHPLRYMVDLSLPRF